MRLPRSRARRRTPRSLGFVAAAVAVLIGSAIALAVAGDTTVTQTIGDRDGDNRLEPGAGEEHLVRDELGLASPGREKRRVARLFFGQFTDSHIVDEESPARVEFLDKFGPPLTSAYRPQEGLSAQVQNEMVRQIRNTVSPVTQRQLQLVMTTGDNSDNTQLNETRWFIDLLDGGVTVDPDSGVPGTCGTVPDGKRYDGVRDEDEYYEPDRSGPAGANSIDGPGYSPYEEENLAEAGRSSSMRDFPGLFEEMNKPFLATGLDLPWYGIFGNHDALLQGNQPRNGAFELIATGCTKVRGLSPTAQAEVAALAAGGITPLEGAQIRRLALAELAAATADPLTYAGLAATVPQDPRRRPLKKSEYIQEHFRTRGRPLGHGFTPANVASGQGNYAFHPRPGIRFVVLDSINEGGGAEGNIDDTQFRWLHAELLAAERKRELVIAFAHHSLRTMNQPAASPFPPGDQGGDSSPLVHFGNGPGEATSPCVITDPGLPPTPEETLRCLFLRHRSVIAFVVGHEHENRIVPNERRAGVGRAEGGFWEITTASHIDWPQQSRVIDLVDNRDGNLSLFGTIIDHTAPPNPGAPPAGDGDGATGESVTRMASISRELSYNDPDARNGDDGRPDARGGRGDRNVELIVRNPYAR